MSDVLIERGYDIGREYIKAGYQNVLGRAFSLAGKAVHDSSREKSGKLANDLIRRNIEERNYIDSNLTLEAFFSILSVLPKKPDKDCLKLEAHDSGITESMISTLYTLGDSKNAHDLYQLSAFSLQSGGYQELGSFLASCFVGDFEWFRDNVYNFLRQKVENPESFEKLVKASLKK